MHEEGARAREAGAETDVHPVDAGLPTPKRHDDVRDNIREGAKPDRPVGRPDGIRPEALPGSSPPDGNDGGGDENGGGNGGGVDGGGVDGGGDGGGDGVGGGDGGGDDEAAAVVDAPAGASDADAGRQRRPGSAAPERDVDDATAARRLRAGGAAGADPGRRHRRRVGAQRPGHRVPTATAGVGPGTAAVSATFLAVGDPLQLVGVRPTRREGSRRVGGLRVRHDRVRNLIPIRLSIRLDRPPPLQPR